jgi:hypothetical protein
LKKRSWAAGNLETATSASLAFNEHYFEYQPRSMHPGRSAAIRMMSYEAVLLNPQVWQAVGKVEHWYEGRYGPEWLHHMHKMNDALAAGHTLEAYIQSVLDKSRAQEA